MTSVELPITGMTRASCANRIEQRPPPPALALGARRLTGPASIPGVCPVEETVVARAPSGPLSEHQVGAA
jgi:hypothetical protein